jgi:ammonium transporter, Amt family
MDSHGLHSQIHITDNTRRLNLDEYIIEERGFIEVKSKGRMKTFIVKGRKT